MTNGYVLMDILVSDVFAIFAKMMEFGKNSVSNIYVCRITKCYFERLGKVVISHNLVLFEVMNEK